jgi:hypothetical protein
MMLDVRHVEVERHVVLHVREREEDDHSVYDLVVHVDPEERDSVSR